MTTGIMTYVLSAHLQSSFPSVMASKSDAFTTHELLTSKCVTL